MFIKNHDGNFIKIKSDLHGIVQHGFASGDAVIIGNDGGAYYLSSDVLLATAPGSYPLSVGQSITFVSDGDVVTSVVALKARPVGVL
jgi:hypothetical protein